MTPRHTVKTGIKATLTPAKLHSKIGKNHDCSDNQVSVAAERQKQIPVNKLAAGRQVMKLVMASGDVSGSIGDIDYLRFVPE